MFLIDFLEDRDDLRGIMFLVLCIHCENEIDPTVDRVGLHMVDLELLECAQALLVGAQEGAPCGAVLLRIEGRGAIEIFGLNVLIIFLEQPSRAGIIDRRFAGTGSYHDGHDNS